MTPLSNPTSANRPPSVVRVARDVRRLLDEGPPVLHELDQLLQLEVITASMGQGRGLDGLRLLLDGIVQEAVLDLDGGGRPLPSEFAWGQPDQNKELGLPFVVAAVLIQREVSAGEPTGHDDPLGRLFEDPWSGCMTELNNALTQLDRLEWHPYFEAETLRRIRSGVASVKDLTRQTVIEDVEGVDAELVYGLVHSAERTIIGVSPPEDKRSRSARSSDYLAAQMAAINSAKVRIERVYLYEDLDEARVLAAFERKIGIETYLLPVTSVRHSEAPDLQPESFGVYDRRRYVQMRWPIERAGSMVHPASLIFSADNDAVLEKVRRFEQLRDSATIFTAADMQDVFADANITFAADSSVVLPAEMTDAVAAAAVLYRNAAAHYERVAQEREMLLTRFWSGWK